MPLLPRSISQQLVQLCTRLHFVNVLLLRPFGFQVCEESINCLHGYSQSRHRIYHTIIPKLLELFDSDARCLTKLRHIGKQ